MEVYIKGTWILEMYLISIEKTEEFFFFVTSPFYERNI
jgi:hypothetical protein